MGPKYNFSLDQQQTINEMDLNADIDAFLRNWHKTGNYRSNAALLLLSSGIRDILKSFTTYLSTVVSASSVEKTECVLFMQKYFKTVQKQAETKCSHIM